LMMVLADRWSATSATALVSAGVPRLSPQLPAVWAVARGFFRSQLTSRRE